MSTALVVEGAHDEAGLAVFARRSVRRYVTFVLPGVAVLVAGAGLLLRPFGPSYAAHGATLLRLLLLGTVPQAVVTLYLGVERVRARVTRVLAVEAGLVSLVIVGGILEMRGYGLAGMGVAWLVAQSAMAAVALPRLRAALRLRGQPGENARDPTARRSPLARRAGTGRAASCGACIPAPPGETDVGWAIRDASYPDISARRTRELKPRVGTKVPVGGG